jgi:hypothetical protein
MTAKQAQIRAGSASALAAVVFGLVGCAAASHPTANAMPRPASQTAAAAHASPLAAARPGTAVRLASPLLKCADPAVPGRARPAAGGVRAAAGPPGPPAVQGGSASPGPIQASGQATLRQVGVVNLSQPPAPVLCRRVIIVRCPPGYRAIYRKIRAAGRRPQVLLPYVAACVARFPGRSLPEPLPAPVPIQTMPMRNMPPQRAGS